MKGTWLAMCVVLAGAVAAQELPPPAEEAAQEDAEERAAPRHRIRVLQHPYEIASFYRSSQGGSFGWTGFAFDPADRYPIASYYRGGLNPRGYSRFWTTGYRGRRGPGLFLDYRRTIGENGDLYLLAPTFLAPLGPLSDFAFGAR
jgi:hypothetical protein